MTFQGRDGWVSRDKLLHESFLPEFFTPLSTLHIIFFFDTRWMTSQAILCGKYYFIYYVFTSVQLPSNINVNRIYFVQVKFVCLFRHTDTQ